MITVFCDRRLLLPAFAVAILLLASCSDDASKPDPPDDPVAPDLAWTVMMDEFGGDFFDVWGSAHTNVVAVGQSGVHRYDGSSWSAMSDPSSSTLNAVWGASGSDIFAVGNDGTIIRYDGTDWEEMTSPTSGDLRGVWGTSASNVYAVGQGGDIIRFDGMSWSDPIDHPGSFVDLHDVWGSSASDVYVVGAAGTMIHYDGTDWELVTGFPSYYLGGISGTSATNIYAVGGGGTVLHYDGTSWSSLTGASGMLEDVYAVSDTDAFIVTAGQIYHHNGTATACVAMTGGVGYSFEGVWASSATDVFVVGYTAFGAHRVIYHGGPK